MKLTNHRITAIVLCPAVALLAACSGTGDTASPSGGYTSLPPTRGISPAAPSSGSTGADDATSARLVLEPTGIGVVSGGSSVRHLEFGSDEDAVSAALESALGGAAATTLPECGQGPRTGLRAGGFSALFDGAKLVGWADEGGAERATADGIEVGSTLMALKATGDVDLSTGSLGVEFRRGDLGGLLESKQPSAKITLLYAGETCFSR